MKLVVTGLLFISFSISATEVETPSHLSLKGEMYTLENEPVQILKNREPKTMSMSSRTLNRNDFIGKFVWKGQNARNKEGVQIKGCLSIMKDPESTDYLLITGFPYDTPLKGYVEDNKLYIPNQVAGYNEQYSEDIWFWNVSIRNPRQEEDQNYYYNVNPNSPFYFSLNDKNELVAGNCDLNDDMLDNFGYSDAELSKNVCIATTTIPKQISQGYFWDCAWIESQHLEDYFTFEESEWTYVGDASFKDAWLQYVWNIWNEGNVVVYDVPLYRFNKDEHRFLLRDPYGPNTPLGKKNYNLKEREGYIIFNIAHPELVVFEPYIYACTIEWNNSEMEMYPYNSEGNRYYLYDNLSVSDIYDTLNVTSRLIESIGMVDIQNALYSRADGEKLMDRRYELNYDRSGYIIMPAGYDGVNEILEDNADYPKEYYNLQGVRLVNPEKGQVVITRQGNRVAKEIMR